MRPETRTQGIPSLLDIWYQSGFEPGARRGHNMTRGRNTMAPEPFETTVRLVRELADEYLGSREIRPVSEDTPAWPRNAGARRMLHRLGILRSAEATLANRRRMAALRMALDTRNDGDDDLFWERLRAYYDPDADGAVCLKQPDCPRCDLRAICKHYAKRPTIKDLPPAQRPRERLMEAGPEALSDAELLAIIIRSGTRDLSALDLARRLLVEYHSLQRLAQVTPQELARNSNLTGIGPAKAAQLGAVMALAARMKASPFIQGDRFSSSRQIYEHYHERLSSLEQELFICMLLDTKNRLILARETSRGGQNSSPVDPRTIFKDAVRHSASAIIFVHNHPSGDPSPSRDDERLTARLKEAAELLEVRVLDHVIIGRGDYFSFADHGLI